VEYSAESKAGLYETIPVCIEDAKTPHGLEFTGTRASTFGPVISTSANLKTIIRARQHYVLNTLLVQRAAEIMSSDPEVFFGPNSSYNLLAACNIQRCKERMLKNFKSPEPFTRPAAWNADGIRKAAESLPLMRLEVDVQQSTKRPIFTLFEHRYNFSHPATPLYDYSTGYKNCNLSVATKCNECNIIARCSGPLTNKNDTWSMGYTLMQMYVPIHLSNQLDRTNLTQSE